MASTNTAFPHLRSLDTIVDELLHEIRLLSANPTYYPWLVIPPDGKSIDEVNTIALPALGVETVVTTYQVPLGYNALIRRISNNYLGGSFNPGLPSLIWRIRSGASLTGSKFVDGYSEIVVEYGTVQHPRDIDGIHVSSGQTLLYTVTNNDPALPVGNSQVTCCFAGLRWPLQRESRMNKMKGKA